MMQNALSITIDDAALNSQSTTTKSVGVRPQDLVPMSIMTHRQGIRAAPDIIADIIATKV